MKDGWEGVDFAAARALHFEGFTVQDRTKQRDHSFIDPNHEPIRVVDVASFHQPSAGKLDVTLCSTVHHELNGDRTSMANIVTARLRLDLGHGPGHRRGPDEADRHGGGDRCHQELSHGIERGEHLHPKPRLRDAHAVVDRGGDPSIRSAQPCWRASWRRWPQPSHPAHRPSATDLGRRAAIVHAPAIMLPFSSWRLSAAA